jgi:hypothetical protein
MAKALNKSATGYATSNRCSFIFKTVTNIAEAEFALKSTENALNPNPKTPLLSVGALP